MTRQWNDLTEAEREEKIQERLDMERGPFIVYSPWDSPRNERERHEIKQIKESGKELNDKNRQ